MKVSIRIASRALIAAAALSLCFGAISFAGSAPANSKVQAQQQQAIDYEETAKEFKRYSFAEVIDPKYRSAGQTQIAPLVKQLAAYEGTVAAKSVGIKKSEWLYAQCEDLALLSLYEDEAATNQLNEYKASKDPITSINGTIGLWLRDWWKEPDEAAQSQLIEQMRQLAKDNPKEDSLARGLLAAEQFGAATDELSAAGRQIITKDLKGIVAAQFRARPNKVGEPLLITGRATTGKMFSTAAWKGKVIIVNIWATWCPHCIASLPELTQVYSQYHDQGLEVVALDCDMDLKALKTFMAEHQQDMPWPELFAPTPPYGFHTLAKAYGIEGVPTVYLIDRNGVLRTTRAWGRLNTWVPKLLAEEVKPQSSTTKPTKGG